METEMLRSKPRYKVDVRKLSIEGLVMLWTFLPNYYHEPEGGIVSAARAELVRRGVIVPVEGGMIDWRLDDDTREELLEVWTIDKMPELFLTLTSPEAST
jgi:hypothetical protein